MISPRGRGAGARDSLAECDEESRAVRLLRDAGNLPAVVFQLHRGQDGLARFVALNERVRELCEIAPDEAYAA